MSPFIDGEQNVVTADGVRSPTMTTWVAGTEESTIAATDGALPGRRGRDAAATSPREPAGIWHAVDADTTRVACGTTRFLEIWPARPWSSSGASDRCDDCVAAVSADV